MTSRRLRESTRAVRLRCVETGATYLITKKTNNDLYLLTPDPLVNQILLYTLVLKARYYGILVHGFCFMSNHFHLVITDARGTLPDFMRDFLADTSRALQIALKVKDRIWEVNRYNAVVLLDLDAAERKLVYTEINPTRAGLTPPGDWPGVSSAHYNRGEQIDADRPGVFFSKRYRPARVTLTLEPLPAAFDDEGDAAATASQRRIEELQDDELGALNEEKEAQDRLAGEKKVRALPRTTKGTRQVGGRRPEFATKNRELMEWAIQARRHFYAQHERAKQLYAEGKKRTSFPPGTYGYRVLLGVRTKRPGYE